MKNTIRLKTVLLTISAMLILYVNDTAAYDFESGCIYYNITSASAPYTVALTSERGSYKGDINIPSSVNYNGTDYSVTEIEGSGFFRCYELISVEVPNSVTNIGVGAFAGCILLKSVSLPAGITTIQDGTFDGCASLTSIIIPPGVTTINKDAFKSCPSLSDIYIMSPEPPTVDPDAFSSYNPTLHVPIGSLDKYKDDDIWKNFTDIEESDFSGVRQNHTGIDIRIYSSGGRILINGAEDNSVVTVYDTQGKTIASAPYGKLSETIFAKGNYIVVTGSTERKITVN